MTKELPKRNEVKKEFTWALEDLYADITAWEADLDEIRGLTEKIEAKREDMIKSAGNLLETLDLWEMCSQKLMYVSSYAYRARDVDTTNTENQGNVQKAAGLRVTVSSRLAFVESRILELEDTTLEAYYETEPGLLKYRLWIRNIIRTRDHRLTTELEELLASAGEVQQVPEQVYSMFNDADLKFPEITDENGEQVRITQGRFISLLNSKERRVRKDAFMGLYQTYEKFQNTLASLFNGQVKQQIFEAKARKYPSTLAASVDASDVDPLVYENLLEAVNENLDKMYRYVGLRKKLLGVDQLHMYDIYVPMVPDLDMEISFEEAKETVLKALEPLGERYVSLVREGFENRWIDIYENEGKRSGAYSAGIYGRHPFVLLNYSGLLDDMFTLAHEMGHAMHSYFSNEAQNYFDAGYETFVAEVASTCNEVLLMKYLLANTTDPQKRAYLLNHFLDSFRTTVYRQTMFAEYEKTTNAMAEAGESLTAGTLKQVYYDLNKKYYGSDMEVDEEIAMEWARIPHFYMNYYVYQYATGFSSAVAIARRILREGEPAVADYMQFLSGGCSKSPVELLKTAGVDMTTKAPIQSALRVFGELLDEMEKITE